MASIDGQTIRAANKSPGTIYISIRLSEVTSYRGTVDQSTVSTVANALEKAGHVSVFKVMSSYDLNTQNRSYGLNITPARARTIYYFDTATESSCTAVKSIVSAIIGMIDCMYYSIPVSTDPNELNLQRDFWLSSGLDMEVVL